MNRNTRKAIVAIAVLSMVALAGCSDSLIQDSYSFDANKSTLDTSNSDYEMESIDSIHQTKNFSVAGENTSINMTIWTSQYSKSATGPSGTERAVSQVILVSAPDARIAGQSVNPLAHFSNEKLVDQLIQKSDTQSLKDVSKEETSKATILGSEENATKFSGTMRVDDRDVPVYIHVTKTTHNGDIVVALQVYPQKFEDQVDFENTASRVQHD